MRLRYYFVFFLILFIAAVLRLYRLDKIPNGFFFDEATISYQAYSLIQTGHDTWGKSWPLFSFKDYGEYILPMGIYGQIPSIILGGLNVFAARFPHAILGIITVFSVMVLGKIQFNKRVGLFSGILLAISPLAIGWNRFVYEGNFGTLFFLMGVLFFSLFLLKRKWLYFSVLFFGLALLSYHIFLVIVPLYVGGLIVFYRKDILQSNRRALTISILLLSVFIIWAAGSVYSGSGRQRFKQAAILLTPEKIDVINHKIGYCRENFNPLFCRIIYNKIVTLPIAYLENYALHFSPQFLGFDGTYLRQNILPRSGLVQFPEILTLAAGIFFLLRFDNKFKGVLLGWLVLYPFANSFTGAGEISRIAFAAPLFAIVSAAGFDYLIKCWRGFKLFAFPLFVSVLLFIFSYFEIFPRTNAYYTNYGYAELYNFINISGGQYQKIYIGSGYSGSMPSISAQFFLPIDPRDFSNPKKIVRIKDNSDYYHITQANNIIFFSDIKHISPTKYDLVVLFEEPENNRAIPIFQIVDPIGRKLLSVYRAKNLYQF